MKKLSILFLAVVLVFSLTACEKNEAYALYNKVAKNLDGLSSLEMDVYMQASMSMDGEAVNMEMQGITRQIIHSDTDIEQEMNMDVLISMPAYDVNERTSATSYYKDGYMYQEMLGEKTKMKLDVDEALSQANTQIVMFNDGAILESELNDLGNGRSELIFVLSSEEMESFMDGFSQGFSQGIGIASADIVFSDLQYTIVVGANDMPESMEIQFDCTMNALGMSLDMDARINMEMLSYNSVSQINYPADLDSYVEY